MTKSSTKIAVGNQVIIPVGTRVRQFGATLARKTSNVVTIRAIEPTRNGKTRIYWKSMGYRTSTVL